MKRYTLWIELIFQNMFCNFVSIVIIAIKLIVNANNPNKRSEGIGGLAWVAAGFMLLSLALIVSGIVLSVATNGSGAMVGGGETV